MSFLMGIATDPTSSIGQTVEVTDKKLRKEDYGFTVEEEDDGENLQAVELSDGDLDVEDYEAGSLSQSQAE
ncbi:hypothetical protein H9Q73_011677 [Fusarium xylarioides]|nr:hypothetical protein H9Q73_011677 [Fusarium xylarioides]